MDTEESREFWRRAEQCADWKRGGINVEEKPDNFDEDFKYRKPEHLMPKFKTCTYCNKLATIEFRTNYTTEYVCDDCLKNIVSNLDKDFYKTKELYNIDIIRCLNEIKI